MKKWLMFVVLYYSAIGAWSLIPHGNPLCLWDMSTMVQASAVGLVPFFISLLWVACKTGCGRIFGDILECIADIF